MLHSSMIVMVGVVCLLYQASGQQASYGTPTGGSASFSSPDAGYGAPEDSYSSAQVSYKRFCKPLLYTCTILYCTPVLYCIVHLYCTLLPPQGYYDYDNAYSPSQDDLGLDLGKITDFLPLFVVVFAAIILAQLLSPLFLQLLMVIMGIVPMAFAVKRPIIDALLAPFGCSLTCKKRSFDGKSFSDSFRSLEGPLGWSETQADMAAAFAETAFETISSE